MLTPHPKSRYVSPNQFRIAARLRPSRSGARLRPVTHDLKLIIGARLRAARRAAGMTQSQLADAVSRTVEAISNIERGKSLPPLDILDRAAGVLKTTLADLVQTPAGEGNLSERAGLEAEAKAMLAELPANHLRAAVRQIAIVRDLAKG